MFNVLDDLSYAFHMMSVLETTLLCIQKTVVIRFPLWGRTHLTTKNSIISALVGVICALFSFIPTTILGTSEMFKDDNGSCCYSERHIFVTLQAEHYLHDDMCTGVLNNSNVVEIGTHLIILICRLQMYYLHDQKLRQHSPLKTCMNGFFPLDFELSWIFIVLVH